MTKAQWDRAATCSRGALRTLQHRTDAETVLSHAEVQTNLGIRQRGSGTLRGLAFDPPVIGAKACGDIFRRRTAELMG